MSEQLRGPDPINLAEARLDADYMNAMDSAEWHNKLSNPGIVRGLGRRVLNSVGIETDAQKALQMHENIMGNYAESAGVDLVEVGGITPDAHAQLRAAAVERGLEDGSVENRRFETKSRVTGTGGQLLSGPRHLGLRNMIANRKSTGPLPGVTELKWNGQPRYDRSINENVTYLGRNKKYKK